MLGDSDCEGPDAGPTAQVFNCGDVHHGHLDRTEGHDAGEEAEECATEGYISPQFEYAWAVLLTVQDKHTNAG